jgi:hypothetical protein
MSNNLEQVGFTGKKLLFPIMIAVAGLALLIVGLQIDEIANERQSSWFLYGSFAILAAGLISILYVIEVINRVVHLSLLMILLVSCIIMAVLSYSSLMRTIEMNAKYEKYVKQNVQKLKDIKKVQEEYKTKYARYPSSLDSLEYFLLNESIIKTVPVYPYKDSVPAVTSIPDRQPNDIEIARLGYDRLNDADLDKIMDGIDEDEAILLGYLKIDTIYTPVYDNIFEKEKKKNESRVYPFDYTKFLDVYVDEDDKNGPRRFAYRFKSTRIDSVTVDTKFKVLDPTPYHHVKGDLQPRDTLYMGDMNRGGTTGSWE